MLKEAVEHYHELLKDADLASRSQQMLDEQLESSKLILAVGVYRLLAAAFCDGKRLAPHQKTCETIFGALQKVKKTLLSRMMRS